MIRIIARLDIKSNYLIKGKQFEGLRKIGDPSSFAENYYNKEVDEIFLIDNVASLYGKTFQLELLNNISKKTFIPITAAGGIDNLTVAKKIFKNGADKIAINSCLIHNLSLLDEFVEYFGSSNIVASIEAKKKNDTWEIYSLGGREKSNIDINEWIKKLALKKPGELLITSIDNDGMHEGFDIDLIKRINNLTDIPLIVSGGFGEMKHIDELLENCSLSAITIGSAFHYNKISIFDIKEHLYKKGYQIRL